MFIHDKTLADRLKMRIENNRAEREAYQRAYDKLQENIKAIVDAPQRIRYSFWCEECQADFTSPAYKVVRKRPATHPIGWYVAYCPARHKCIRRITDKPNDPYFVRSRVVRLDRARHRDDLLTPDDVRFWQLYGHKHGFDAYKSIDNDGKPPHQTSADGG